MKNFLVCVLLLAACGGRATPVASSQQDPGELASRGGEALPAPSSANRADRAMYRGTWQVLLSCSHWSDWTMDGGGISFWETDAIGLVGFIAYAPNKLDCPIDARVTGNDLAGWFGERDTCGLVSGQTALHLVGNLRGTFVEDRQHFEGTIEGRAQNGPTSCVFDGTWVADLLR